MNIKRIIAIILALALALSLTACGDNSTDNEAESSSNSSEEVASTGFVNFYEGYNVSDYVILGNYKNIEVTVDNSPVTEEDIERLINSELQYYATSTLELTEGVAQMDDYATIDYVGYIDGETFSNGTAKDKTILIGSGDMIEGFEDALIGKNIGEEFEVNLTFPEDYGTDEIKGKDVVFKVTITKVKRYTYPELTNEFVAESFGYNTVAEFKDSAKAYLEDSRITEVEDATKEAVFQEILNNSTIIKLPEDKVSYYADIMYSQYEYMASYNGYQDLESYIKENHGMTIEDLTEYCTEYAEYYVTKDLLMLAILEAENTEITDEMYTQMIGAYAAVDGYSDVDSYEQEQTNLTLSTRVVLDLGIEAALQTAKINYTSEDKVAELDNAEASDAE